MKFRLLLCILFGIGFLQLPAQYNLQSGMLRDHSFSISSNPANLHYLEFDKFEYSGAGALWLGNNRATLEGIFVEGNTITDETSIRLVSEMANGDNRFNGGLQLDLAQVSTQFGDQKVSFHLREQFSATAAFGAPRTLGLLLRGNGPYAGDTISDNDIDAAVYNFRALGASTVFDLNDKLHLGVGLSLLQGRQFFEVERAEYSLFTSTNGTQVDLNADYAFRSTPEFGSPGLFGFNGFGASVEAGLVYEVNEKMDVAFAVTDLGFVSWTTDKFERVIELNEFEGIFIENILEDSLQPLIDAEVDSLTNLVVPDSSRESYMTLSPVRLRADYTYRLGENNSISGTIIYSPLSVGPVTPLPLVNVTYQHEVIDGLTLGANAYGGGVDVYGVGLMGNYRFAAGSTRIDILLGSDNLIGWLAPSAARGMSVYGGVGIGLQAE